MKMAHFWKLYTHELRKMGMPYLIVLIAFIAGNGLLFLKYYNTGTGNLVFHYIVLALFYIAFPILFTISFRKEDVSRADYLSFSLPMHRSTVLLSRFMAAFSLLVVSFGFAVLSSFVLSFLLEKYMVLFYQNTMHQLNVYHPDVWGTTINKSAHFFLAKLGFLCTFVIMGIVTLTRSLQYIFRWFNEFLCDFSSLVLFILFCWLGLSHLTLRNVEPIILGQVVLMIGIAAGLFFLAMGIFVFEKYGEV
jgi:hypothetical protein